MYNEEGSKRARSQERKTILNYNHGTIYSNDTMLYSRELFRLLCRRLVTSVRGFQISSDTASYTMQQTSANPDAQDKAKRIVWVDLEMTGLDVEKDHILEIACLVTDAHLNVVATGPDLIIHQPDRILDAMNEWCIAQHGKTGLTEASRTSTLTVADAEKEVLNFLRPHVYKQKCPLAGNSVYMDRMFITKYMPKLNEYLHYRIIDVSTVKELAQRWYPAQYSRQPMKKCQHRSLSDIMESIEELKYYKEHMFKR